MDFFFDICMKVCPGILKVKEVLRFVCCQDIDYRQRKYETSTIQPTKFESSNNFNFFEKCHQLLLLITETFTH